MSLNIKNLTCLGVAFLWAMTAIYPFVLSIIIEKVSHVNFKLWFETFAHGSIVILLMCSAQIVLILI